MLNIGVDIDVGERNIATRRAKSGKCQSCGTRTHKVGFMGKKTPLTVKGVVLQGRCLNCNPLEGQARSPAQQRTQQFTSSLRTAQAASMVRPPLSRPEQTHLQRPAQRPPLPTMQSRRQPPNQRQPSQQSFAVPRTLQVQHDDDGDLSVITMDIRLLNTYDSDDDDDVANMPAVRRRPGPEDSMGGDSPSRPPSFSRTQSRKPSTGPPSRNQDVLLPGGMDALLKKKSTAIPRATNGESEIVLNGEIPLQQEVREDDIVLPPVLVSSKSGPMYQMSDFPDSSEDNNQNNSNRINTVASPPLMDSRLRGRPDDDLIADPMSNFDQGRGVTSTNVVDTAAPSADKISDMISKLSDSPKRKPKKDLGIHEIPAILHCLNLDEANSHMREKAFEQLAEIMWKSGEKARNFILEHKGIDTLVKSMWDDMGVPQVQDSALHFLFSLAASSDGRGSSDILSNQESICDSLLFSMQTHITVPSIQLRGCSILACLASASSNNKKISDGSLSGAQMMALNAISYHSSSKEIQKAGIQAIYFQCSLSEYAESNKRSLMNATLDNERSGINTMVDAMIALSDDIIAMEWASKLCWCLTSSEDLVNLISGVSVVVEQVMKTCQKHLRNPEAAGLIEASFGVFGNLAHLENVRSDLHHLGVIPVLVDGMRLHQNDFGVNIEACSAIANLSLSSDIRDSIIAAGGRDLVILAMEKFNDSPDLVAEAVRALVCMAINSRSGKDQICLPEIINTVVQGTLRHDDASLLKEMGSTLIASLAVGPLVNKMIINSGGVKILIQALQDDSDEKTKDAATLAIRNLSCHVDNCNDLLQPDVINGLIQAMSSHQHSESIHMSACCAIWNLSVHSANPPGLIVGTESVDAIVKAMQNSMESGDLLELACGALWSIMDHAVDRGRNVVGSGAIDAVACAMVMHPNRTPLLEKACGFFATSSMENSLAETIARSQGVSITAEVMRNNSSYIPLLEVGCLVLRNIIYVLPDLAQEASTVVSVVINAMKENMDAVGFQREACNLLWILASEKEGCQSKILALDGVATLMKCLEHNSSESSVQEAALGAFNQLAARQDDN